MVVTTNKGEVEDEIKKIAAVLHTMRGGSGKERPDQMYTQIIALGALFFASIGADLQDAGKAEHDAREVAADMMRPKMPN